MKALSFSESMRIGKILSSQLTGVLFPALGQLQ